MLRRYVFSLPDRRGVGKQYTGLHGSLAAGQAGGQKKSIGKRAFKPYLIVVLSISKRPTGYGTWEDRTHLQAKVMLKWSIRGQDQNKERS